jgi:hypothetical protein
VGILVAAAPPFELTRTIYTDSAYQAISDKTLRSTFFSARISRHDCGRSRATLSYPIPTGANAIVLYDKTAVSSFSRPDHAG